MSEIIKEPNGFKEIKCVCCGCVYKWEQGDEIDFVEFSFDSDVGLARLECPCCGVENKLERIENGK